MIRQCMLLGRIASFRFSPKAVLGDRSAWLAGANMSCCAPRSNTDNVDRPISMQQACEAPTSRFANSEKGTGHSLGCMWHPCPRTEASKVTNQTSVGHGEA